MIFTKEPQDKVYYNITIPYDGTDNACQNNMLGGSEARTMIEMKDDLLNKPDDYVLGISKIKIDTAGLPLMIPEMLVPQPVNAQGAPVNSYEMVSVYEVGLKYLGPKKTDTTKWFKCEKHQSVIFYTKEHDFSKGGKKNGEYVGYYEPGKTQVPWIKKKYINNSDEECFVYSYSELIFAINNAIGRCYEKLLKENADIFDSYCAAPKIEIGSGNTLSLYEMMGIASDKNECDPYISLGISTKLHHYIDMGLNTYYENGFFWYMNGDIYMSGARKIRSPTFINLRATYTNVTVNKETRRYRRSPTLKSFTKNWCDVKAILITSQQLPIAGEFLPTYQPDAFLLHTKDVGTATAYKEVYKREEVPDKGVFLRGQEKIIEVFFLKPSTGDVQLVFNNQDVENTNKITLLGSSPVRKFDIAVRWLDCYDNIHPLLIPPGSSVDIRLVFTKKKDDKMVRPLPPVSFIGEDEVMPLPVEKKLKRDRKSKKKTNEVPPQPPIDNPQISTNRGNGLSFYKFI
jgi:hypothetical protein